LKKGDLGGFKKTSNQKEILANAITSFLNAPKLLTILLIILLFFNRKLKTENRKRH
jgi:hypothetical protein